MKFSLDPKGRHAVTVAFEADDGAAHGTLDAGGVDDLVRRLVAVREGLLPVHAAEPGDASEEPYAGDNMLWQVRPAPSKRGIELAIHNAGLGWISLTLSRAQVEDLVTSFEFALAQMPQIRAAQCRDAVVPEPAAEAAEQEHA